MAQISVLDHQRDAVVETVATDKAERMIQQLVRLRGIGVQSATLLVREARAAPPRRSWNQPTTALCG
jgi:transposase